MRVAALVAAGVTAIVLDGCAATPKAPVAPPVASPVDNPAAVVAAAAKKLGTGPAQFALAWSKASQVGHGRFVEDGGVTAGGDWHLEYDGGLMRHVGRDFYYTAWPGYQLQQAPRGWHAGVWLHTDKIHDVTNPLTFMDGFPWTLAREAARGTEVTRTGDHQFTLRGLPRVPSGPQKGEMHIVVTIDDTGHFTKMIFEADSARPEPDPYVLTLTFSDYGTRVTVFKPTSSVREDTGDAWVVQGLL